MSHRTPVQVDRTKQAASTVDNLATKEGQQKRAPEFAPVAGEGEAKGIVNQNQSVAKLKIHSDTETADRSKLSFGELQQARVGHSWISLEYNDPNAVPDTIAEPTKSLIQLGYASFGFWPLINRTGDMTLPDESQQRVDAGLTPGAGTSNDTAHTGFSLNPFKWVPGRVEEPDNAHSPKGTKTYSLNQEEVNKLLAYVNSKRGADYNLYKYNCTTFAVDAVKAAGKAAPGGDMFGGICLPNALYKDIYEMSLDGDKDVELAPLAEGETHGSKPKRHRGNDANK
jgi:hypothetical protein